LPSIAAKVLDRLRSRLIATLAFPRDLLRFRRLSVAGEAWRRPRVGDLHPCLRDRTTLTTFDRHYVYHPAWAIRILRDTAPAEHVDISSILAFAAMASAIVPTRFYDYRPAPLVLDGLTCGRADLTALPFADRSLASLSCMHVIEHIGLGRYGDPIDPDGDTKALAELARVLAPGGTLLVVVPVGRPRVCFNAHRVYDVESIVARLPGLRLVSFALIPDPPAPGTPERGIIDPADPALVRQQSYGCGCFRFERPRT
jgi:SAM-dependent methyltransferase